MRVRDGGKVFAGWLCVAWIAAACGALGGGAAWAQGEDGAAQADSGQAWALLIGVEKYHRAAPLRFTVNDVKQLAQTLRVRGGVDRRKVLEMTDASATPRLQPLKASLLAEIPAFLKRVGPNDRVIVYFSGHGFRDPQGRLYLGPLDCDPARAAETGVPVAWLREQIAACRAEFKLLVLDACHAGSEKGEDDPAAVESKDLGAEFADLEQVVTLASSSANEKSQIWDQMEQSLFSYWLNQGLKGHADRDASGSVDIDELYEFVSRRVKQTAQARFARPQSPKRIVRSGVDGVPTVLRLAPASLKQLLADVADQLALAMEERTLAKVGVLEFTSQSPLGGEVLRGEFGLLGRYCAEELERQLIDRGVGQFSVVDRRRLQASLSEQGFSVDDLASSAALKSLSARTGGLPALVHGVIRGRAGRVIHLRCELLETEDDLLPGAAGGSAVVSESEWAMLGRSVAVRPEDRQPVVAIDPENETHPADQLIAALDKRATEPHPMKDAKFPFRVWLQVGGQRREGIFRGNDLLVPVRKGETFTIYVENHSGQLALLRLLVDGLNTLPEKVTEKGIDAYEWGKPVNLGEARHWILDPTDAVRYPFRGFVTETGEKGKLREFVVTDVERSVAAQRRFTDNVGLITAAFYRPTGVSRGPIAVGAGREREEYLKERNSSKPGGLIGVVHLRYVDAEDVGR